MAAPNWKNVPASAFIAGKPRARRPVLAAHFPGTCSDPERSLSTEESSPQTQRSCHKLGSETASAGISGSGRGWKLSVLSSTGEGTGEKAQVASCSVESNKHSLSFELQSVSTAYPSKPSLQDHVHAPGGGLPTKTEVLLSPGSPSHTNIHATDIVDDSNLPPCAHGVQSSDTDSRQNPLLQAGQTTQPSLLSQEQRNLVSGKPYKFGSFPSTAFRISPLSGIFGRLFPLQSPGHVSFVSSSGSPSGEYHSSSTEVEEELMDLGLDLDDETSLTHASGQDGTEEGSAVKEKESHERSVVMDSSPGKMVAEGEDDTSHSSFLAMDVEGLLLEACPKSVSKGDVWAKYPNRVELSSSIDVERVALEHRAERKQKGSRSKHIKGASWRDQTDGAGSRDTARRKRLRGRKKTEEGEEEEEEGGGGNVVGQKEKGTAKKYKKPKKPTPNAFISVRIPSPQIRSGLETVQKGMLEKEKAIRSTLAPLKKLHLTLGVIRLEKGDEERAKSALFDSTQRAVAELCLRAQPLTLEFSGVASYGKRVVFAGLVEGESSERLTAMADIVRSVFDQHGFPVTDGRTFSPHLTIAKMSFYREPRRHTRGTRRERHRRLTGITEEHYAEFKDAHFGMQTVTGLELLSMTEPEDKEGYYHCFQRLSFDDISVKSLPVEQQTGCVSSNNELSPETKSSEDSPKAKTIGITKECESQKEV